MASKAVFRQPIDGHLLPSLALAQRWGLYILLICKESCTFYSLKTFIPQLTDLSVEVYTGTQPPSTHRNLGRSTVQRTLVDSDLRAFFSERTLNEQDFRFWSSHSKSFQSHLRRYCRHLRSLSMWAFSSSPSIVPTLLKLQMELGEKLGMKVDPLLMVVNMSYSLSLDLALVGS
ncbi:hypothetical protein QL285_075396 [Trifolium repens]|nr:hypothetical protein QL285_075396 [Trifolium repens]